MLWAILLLSLQDPPPQIIFRTEKAEYIPWINKCKEAEGLLESDPRGAIERLDDILANAKLKKIEISVRIEERPAEYQPPYAFYPFQYSGRARLALARKSDPEAAETILARAVEHLQKSFDGGIKSSEPYLKAAREELQKAKAAAAKPAPPAADPLAKFKLPFDELLASHKYRSARAKIDKDGKDLTDAQKKSLADSAERACRAYLNGQVLNVRRNLVTLVRSERDLLAMRDLEFADYFSLPPPDELAVTLPAYDWARAWLPVLKDVQSGKAPASSLLGAAAAAVPLEEQGDKSWFEVTERIAFEHLRDAIRVEVDGARDEARADRDKRRQKAEARHAAWKDFAGKLDPKFRQRQKVVDDHDRELASLFAGFPADLAELEKIDLEACFAATSPEEALAQLDLKLAELEGRGRVSRESRQKLYTWRATAAALRGLLEGRGEDEVARGLEEYGPKLRAVGGPLDPGRFGPRVAAVLAKLR